MGPNRKQSKFECNPGFVNYPDAAPRPAFRGNYFRFASSGTLAKMSPNLVTIELFSDGSYGRLSGCLSLHRPLVSL